MFELDEKTYVESELKERDLEQRNQVLSVAEFFHSEIEALASFDALESTANIIFSDHILVAFNVM